MNNSIAAASPLIVDPYVESIKNAKKRTATIKLRLVQLRSALPNTPVFVFEGADDKIVYSHWISRIRPELEYEPLPCHGKELVLDFRKSLTFDVSNLGDNVYYFVDRDFDDLDGHPDGRDIFMSDYYSIENYLVCEHVLSKMLKNEFHCDGAPKTRESVINLFKSLLNEFSNIINEINLKLYIARKLKIELAQVLPEKISLIAAIALESVSKSFQVSEDVIKYKVYAAPNSLPPLEEEFSKLDPRTRHRGKFFYMFFRKWLDLLALDRMATPSRLFSNLSRANKVKLNEISIGSLAAKSAIPSGLSQFLDGVKTQ